MENIEKLRERILSIGAGELDYWKYSVLTEEHLFGQIYSFIYSAEEKLAWRSAWIIDAATENYPELLSEHIPDLVVLLMKTNCSSLQRIITRALTRYKIPDDLLGAVFNRCLRLMLNAEPVAVRVNAMQMLFNISQQEPELKPELAAVISSLIEEGGGAGLINRAEKLLKQLEGRKWKFY